eukprot:scaffold1166_cov261-Pinguiococcus_pyrenoidosus.AAC.33
MSLLRVPPQAAQLSTPPGVQWRTVPRAMTGCRKDAPEGRCHPFPKFVVTRPPKHAQTTETQWDRRWKTRARGSFRRGRLSHSAEERGGLPESVRVSGARKRPATNTEEMLSSVAGRLWKKELLLGISCIS